MTELVSTTPSPPQRPTNGAGLWRLLLPVEWLVVIFTALTAALYGSLEVALPAQPGSGTSKDPALFYIKQLLAVVYLYAHVLIGMIMLQTVAFAWRHRGDLRHAPWPKLGGDISARFSLRTVGSHLRCMNAPLVMFVVFALMKNLIPHVNGAIHDEWFLASDRFVCGGTSCSELLHATIGRSPETVATVTSHYFWYYPYLALVALAFIFFAPRALTDEFLFAFVGLFFFGTLAIYAAPTWGPVYYRPEDFSFFAGTEIHGLQQRLWEMKVALAEGRARGDDIFMISGFPSLHIAVTVLGSIYLMSIHRVLGVLSWLFVVLTVNSTLYLGWHYLLDDVGAVILVFGVRALAQRVCGGTAAPARANS